jgi:hypothetical protein
MAKMTKRSLMRALMEERGCISAAARRLGVTRQAVQKRIDRDESGALRQSVIDARETLIDNAERSLARGVDAGEAWATCFTLKTIGASRGYVEKQQHEMSGPGGGAFKQEVTGHVSVSIEEALAGCEAAFAAATIREGQEAGILPHDLQQPLPADEMEHAGLGEAGRAGSANGDDAAEPAAD